MCDCVLGEGRLALAIGAAQISRHDSIGSADRLIGAINNTPIQIAQPNLSNDGILDGPNAFLMSLNPPESGGNT